MIKRLSTFFIFWLLAQSASAAILSSPNPGALPQTSGGGTASSIAFVQSTQTFNGGTAIAVISATFTVATSAGATLPVFIKSSGQGQFNSCTDNKPNIYTFQGISVGDGSSRVQLWVSSNALAGVTWVSCTGGSAANYGISIMEFSGITGSTGTAGTFVSSTSLINGPTQYTTSTGTLSGLSNAYFCGATGSATGNVTITAGDGYTAVTNYGSNGSATGEFFTEYQIGSRNIPCDWGITSTTADGRAKSNWGEARR